MEKREEGGNKEKEKGVWFKGRCVGVISFLFPIDTA